MSPYGCVSTIQGQSIIIMSYYYCSLWLRYADGHSSEFTLIDRSFHRPIGEAE